MWQAGGEVVCVFGGGFEFWLFVPEGTDLTRR